VQWQDAALTAEFPALRPKMTLCSPTYGVDTGPGPVLPEELKRHGHCSFFGTGLRPRDGLEIGTYDKEMADRELESMNAGGIRLTTTDMLRATCLRHPQVPLPLLNARTSCGETVSPDLCAAEGEGRNRLHQALAAAKYAQTIPRARDKTPCRWTST